ncbi:MAG: acyl-CoA-binding protein [Bacteroidia bacterium]|jgi:acyl-CoA-binding protein|nr:acyl-CoA-binding protein [Bacteroidia bacterium]
MELATAFEEASKLVHTLKERPSNDILLTLYALHKQASSGDAHDNKPPIFDFIATAKYNAWLSKKGLSTEEAQKEYIDLVKKLLDEQS